VADGKESDTRCRDPAYVCLRRFDWDGKARQRRALRPIRLEQVRCWARRAYRRHLRSPANKERSRRVQVCRPSQRECWARRGSDGLSIRRSLTRSGLGAPRRELRLSDGPTLGEERRVVAPDATKVGRDRRPTEPERQGHDLIRDRPLGVLKLGAADEERTRQSSPGPAGARRGFDWPDDPETLEGARAVGKAMKAAIAGGPRQEAAQPDSRNPAHHEEHSVIRRPSSAPGNTPERPRVAAWSWRP
jgi:hypothetical protein